jgi:hypothetical protein
VWGDAPDVFGNLFASRPGGLGVLAPFLLSVGLWLPGTGVQSFCGGVGLLVHRGVGGQGVSIQGIIATFLGWGGWVFIVGSLCSSWSNCSDIQLRSFSKLGSRVDLFSVRRGVCM